MRSPAASATPVLLAAVALALAGCGRPDDDAVPSASPPPAMPTHSATLPTAQPSLEDWAATALPENALGGSTALVRAVGAVGVPGAAIELPPGGADLVMACRSADGAPLVVEIGGEPAEVACADPGGTAVTPTRLPLRGSTMRLSALVDTVYVYEVHPRPET